MPAACLLVALRRSEVHVIDDGALPRCSKREEVYVILQYRAGGNQRIPEDRAADDAYFYGSRFPLWPDRHG